MPTYLYGCPKCKREMEIEQPISKRTTPLCLAEGCGEIEMESLICSTSFVLKGKSWARDGYSGKRALRK